MAQTDDEDEDYLIEPMSAEFCQGCDTDAEASNMQMLASIAISLKRIADRLDEAGGTLKSAVAKARIV